MKVMNSKRSGGARKYHKSEHPRLRWTPQLHEYFVETVESLGGKHKATPKRILQMMHVKGLRISHIKSHLQMYRNMKGHTILAPMHQLLEENAQINDLPISSDCSPQRSRVINNQEHKPLYNKGLSQTSETDYDLNQEPESSAYLLSEMSNEEENSTTTKVLDLPFSFSTRQIPMMHSDQERMQFSSPNTVDNHVIDSSSSIQSHGNNHVNLDLTI